MWWSWDDVQGDRGTQLHIVHHRLDRYLVGIGIYEHGPYRVDDTIEVGDFHGDGGFDNVVEEFRERFELCVGLRLPVSRRLEASL